MASSQNQKQASKSSGLAEAVFSDLRVMVIFLGCMWAGSGFLIGHSIERAVETGESFAQIGISVGGIIGMALGLSIMLARRFLTNIKQ